MIPTLLVLGLPLGAVLLRRSCVLVTALVVVSLMWGILVGSIDDDPSASLVVGATALGAANLAVGAAVGAGLRAGIETIRRREPSRL